MIELIIEPAQYLIDALQSKTAPQLIDLIYQSQGCERIASVAIHLTAIDMLMRNHPHEYAEFINAHTLPNARFTEMG